MVVRRRPRSAVAHDVAPEKAGSPKSDALQPQAPSFAVAVVLLSIPRLVAALMQPVTDCDEVFNYWEPLHYITHGFGQQTWEYSPDYALRSYAYLLPYAALLKIAEATVPTHLLFIAPKVALFYAVRIALASASAVVEGLLVNSVGATLGASTAWATLFGLALAPGMMISAAAFLPSSFAMVCFSLALRAAMLRQHKPVVAWMVIGGWVGWPFVGLLCVPLAGLILLEYRRLRWVGLGSFVAWSLAFFVLVAASTAIIDSFFYGRWVVPPWNIVKYNVLSGAGNDAGSELYGTEPWYFYLLNLALNFNLLLPLSLLSPLAILTCSPPADRMRELLIVSPYFIWLGFLSTRHADRSNRTPRAFVRGISTVWSLGMRLKHAACCIPTNPWRVLCYLIRAVWQAAQGRAIHVRGLPVAVRCSRDQLRPRHVRTPTRACPGSARAGLRRSGVGVALTLGQQHHRVPRRDAGLGVPGGGRGSQAGGGRAFSRAGLRRQGVVPV